MQVDYEVPDNWLDFGNGGDGFEDGLADSVINTANRWGIDVVVAFGPEEAK